MLRSRHAHLVSYGYAAAEAECERLALALGRELGAGELARCRFVAIPRGGLIVLGILSYQLGLRAEQLLPEALPGAPMVVIDDCALTGQRLRQALCRLPASEVVVGHLCSPSKLRRAVLAAEPRVRACLAARDLEELPASPDAAAEAAWSERWQARLGGEGYWIGRVQPVVFPWSEPDMPFFNRATERVEQGWRFAPPDRCLKVRAALDPRARERRDGAFRAPPGLIHGSFDGVLWLCAPGTGEVVSLHGLGSDAWALLAAGVPLAEALGELAAAHDLPGPELAGEVSAFVAGLLERGLLEEVERGG